MDIEQLKDALKHDVKFIYAILGLPEPHRTQLLC